VHRIHYDEDELPWHGYEGNPVVEVI